MFKVSFIIPSYNSFKTIPKTLDSIFGLNAENFIYEVIVIDCSDDGKTRNILKSYTNSKLRLVEFENKVSPASGRNTGAAMAGGDLLCFIDSDVFLDEWWLDHILKAYQNGCRAGGGSIGVPYFQKKNFLAWAQFYLQFNEYLQSGQTRSVTMVPACNMFVDRKLFRQTGGFPKLRASEDVLFCLNYARYGLIWFVPQAHCFHIFREEKKPYFQNQKMLGQYIIIYRQLFYKKWYYKKPWAAVLLPIFVMIKTINITRRIAKAGKVHLEKFILSFPLVVAGLFYWSIGFYQGSQKTIVGLDN